jgi:hypothetical protein
MCQAHQLYNQDIPRLPTMDFRYESSQEYEPRSNLPKVKPEWGQIAPMKILQNCLMPFPGCHLAGFFIPRTTVLMRVEEYLQISLKSRIDTSLFIPRAAVLMSVSQDLYIEVERSVRTGIDVPRTTVFMRLALARSAMY